MVTPMPISNLAIKSAKPSAKPIKLFDGRGLFLLIHPKGGKWWRLKYFFNGKEKLISLGTYPEISLLEARLRREECRQLIAKGIDPSHHRKATKNAAAERDKNSFEAIAREWLMKQSSSWTPSHGTRVLKRLERDIFSVIGKNPVSHLSAKDVLVAIRRIEQRGAIETAHRALNNCSQIMRYAVQTGRADRDPCGDLKGALPSVKTRHLPAVTNPEQVADLMRKIAGYTGTHVVRTALMLAPLFFVRPGELRTAKWCDIDLEASEWRFIASKTGTNHIVPLATQAVDLLRQLKMFTGHSNYVFPGMRSRTRPMSDNAILAALRSLGIPKEEMSGHGFRAMARTILEEILGFRPEIIEHQLAHSVRDPLGRAYNRTTHLTERRRMMQEWADWLDAIKLGSTKVDH
jgi:integrase